MGEMLTKEAKLSPYKRLMLRLHGYVFLRYERRINWSGSLPIYLVRCKKHGLFEDYPHGHSNKFHCPKCLEEKLNEEK